MKQQIDEYAKANGAQVIVDECKDGFIVRYERVNSFHGWHFVETKRLFFQSKQALCDFFREALRDPGNRVAHVYVDGNS